MTGVGYSGGSSGSANWDIYPQAFVRYVDCTFDSSLDTAWYNVYGSQGHINYMFDSCEFAVGSYAFVANTWNDSGARGMLQVINPVYSPSTRQIDYLRGASGATQDHCWLYHSGTLVGAQARNGIGTQYGIATISVANAETNARVGAIQRSDRTVVTTSEPHGFETGDKILLDGFASSGNGSWFQSLSPHSNVPLFSAEVMSTAQFRIKNAAGTEYLDSSDFAADYTPSADIAHVSLYPLRTIIGSASDDPAHERPAGLVGDRWNAGGLSYRCVTSGVSGGAVWVAE